MCRKCCLATHDPDPCRECLAEWVEDVRQWREFIALCNSDPERQPGYRYATEAEWRDYRNAS